MLLAFLFHINAEIWSVRAAWIFFQIVSYRKPNFFALTLREVVATLQDNVMSMLQRLKVTKAVVTFLRDGFTSSGSGGAFICILYVEDEMRNLI
uniref:Uncharacterized protein n=1 Tax=Pyxicephalus adspersus TaxID=30357 RepID=A0AAV2ZMX5_PYXAD|nr:TPA: hypothetical protein GDO54_016123 [Pyxicephalus adspersus]